jgi:hypothetical protein
MHFAITGNGTFVPTEGTATARVRLFLQQRDDRLTAQEPYKLWWSVIYVELHDGEFTPRYRRASGRQCSARAGPGTERVQRGDIPARECWLYVRWHVRRPWRLSHGRERPLYS